MKIVVLTIVSILFAFYGIVAILSGLSSMRTLFEHDVKELIDSHPQINHLRINEEQLSKLPDCARNYLISTGFATHEKIEFAGATYTGKIALSAGKFMTIKCEQYNSLPELTRIWYGRINLLPFIYIDGRHIYKNGKANMLIKFGPFKLIDISGEEINQSDTLTFFNDMFLFMPSAIVNNHTTWTEIDNSRCKVDYQTEKIKVSAELVFNEKNELITFMTNDRYKIDGNQSERLPWITPMTEYVRINNFRVPQNLSAIWIKEEKEEPYFIVNDNKMQRFYNDEAFDRVDKF